MIYFRNRNRLHKFCIQSFQREAISQCVLPAVQLNGAGRVARGVGVGALRSAAEEVPRGTEVLIAHRAPAQHRRAGAGAGAGSC